jgi:hypothetical protein
MHPVLAENRAQGRLMRRLKRQGDVAEWIIITQYNLHARQLLVLVKLDCVLNLIKISRIPGVLGPVVVSGIVEVGIRPA